MNPLKTRSILPFASARDALPIALLAAVLAALPMNSHAQGGAPPPTFRLELSDQFGVAQQLSFPTTNLTLLTIADRKGSEQIPGWVSPVHEQFGREISIWGIADMSSVPSVLRGVAARTFRRMQSHPVMLDWSGESAKWFRCEPDQANVLLLDRDGKILLRFTGTASQAGVQALLERIRRSRANPE